MTLEKKIENLIQTELDKHELDDDLSFTLTEITAIMRDIRLTIREVAQQIRARITELSKALKRLEESTGCSSLDLEAKVSFEREIRQLTWVLGLLVENSKVDGGEKEQ